MIGHVPIYGRSKTALFFILGWGAALFSPEGLGKVAHVAKPAGNRSLRYRQVSFCEQIDCILDPYIIQIFHKCFIEAFFEKTAKVFI